MFDRAGAAICRGQIPRRGFYFITIGKYTTHTGALVAVAVGVLVGRGVGVTVGVLVGN